MRKKVIQFACTVFLICLLSVGMTICCSAAIYTPYEAKLWAEKQVGKTYGEGDPLSFIQAYMSEIGAVIPSVSTANAYTTCALPSGWKRVKAADGEPCTGDILIFTGNKDSGAMGIYYRQTTQPYSKSIFMQGPWNNSSVVEWKAVDYDDSMFRNYRYGYDYWGFIQPNYANISVKNIRFSDISTTSYTVNIDLKNPSGLDKSNLMLKTELTDSNGKILSSGIGNVYTIIQKNSDGWSISEECKTWGSDETMKEGEKYIFSVTPQYGGISYPVMTASFTVPGTVTNPQVTPKPTKKTTKAYVGNLRYKATKSSKGNTAVVIGVKNKNLTSVKIPSTVKIKGVNYKVTGIYKKAFYFNKKLKTITIGKNVKSIGSEAFSHCYKLKTIKVYSKVIYSIGDKAFESTAKGSVVYVPKKSSKAYRRRFSKGGIVKATL